MSRETDNDVLIKSIVAATGMTEEEAKEQTEQEEGRHIELNIQDRTEVKEKFG